MPAGYIIAQVEITDPEAYEAYRAQVPATTARVRGGWGSVPCSSGLVGVLCIAVNEDQGCVQRNRAGRAVRGQGEPGSGPSLLRGRL